MRKTDIVRLQHMIDSGKKAISFILNRQRVDLDQDEMLTLALVRLLEILGEAGKNVSEATKAKSPNIPWRLICGTRDRLIHAYFDINLDIVWEIVNQDLPSLIPQLESLLNEIKNN